MKMSRVVVVVNFILRRVHPCKERAHAGFDFKGDTVPSKTLQLHELTSSGINID